MQILKLGASGSDVKNLQDKLKKLGFYPGTVDGQFGSATQLAVKEFQKSKGLSVDGSVGSVTIEELAQVADTPIVMGIDINDNSVDWQAVKKSNISFAIIKATEGSDWINHQFDSHWQGIKQAGLICGAYHFFQPLTNIETQISNFLEKIENVLESGDLSPVLDLEDAPDYMKKRWEQIHLEERINRVNQWLETVQQKTGYQPIIYTNPSFWTNFMEDTEKFTHYPLWIANYDVTKPDIPANNWGGKGYTIWQNTDTGAVDGISGSVDRNRFKGSFDELVAFVNSTKVA